MTQKRTIKIIFTSIALLVTALMLVMTIKPGAAVFFVKQELSAEKVEFSDRLIIYPITLSDQFYDQETLLVRDGTQIFSRIKTEELPGRLEPAFAVEQLDSDDLIVRIVSDSAEDETANLKSIQILVRPRFITQTWFKFLAISLTVGFGLATMSILLKPESRKSITSGFWGFLNIWNRKESFGEVIKRKLDILLNAVVQAVFVAFLYIFLEWLFFVTKPSFMDILTFGQKVSVLFISGFALWLLIAALILIVFCLDMFFSVLITPFSDFPYSLPASLCLSGLVLILVDNFTYTVFRFGVSTVDNGLRVLYIAGFLIVFTIIQLSLTKKVNAPKSRSGRGNALWVAGSILLISIVYLAIDFHPIQGHFSDLTAEEDYRTPNIILVSDDGLNANNMSLYGYERETTPFLDSLASSSLLMLNNFANANTSTGSDTAMLTGKSPFDTKVMYPPNTLEGLDTLEHLPGMLRKLGYRNISIGVPHFVDVGVINFDNAFDSVNGEDILPLNLLSKASSFGYSDPVYFLETLAGRLTSRVLHIFFIKDMENVYLQVTDPSPTEIFMNMDSSYHTLLNNLDQANQNGQPLFAHIHLLSTHGAKFYPENRVFSAGQEQNENWMVDFYDDAILEYDQWLADLVSAFKENGYYQNTVIVFYTDHGEQWSAKSRVPLMIHFPNDAYAGELAANSQNMDIAPTILEYIGLDQPQWMTGSSLIGEIETDRIIYTAEIDGKTISYGSLDREMIQPPFYQFGFINVIQCQNLFEIDLKTGEMIKRSLSGYVQPCPPAELDEPAVIWDSAMALLRSYGYDIPAGWKEPVRFLEE